MLTQKRCMLTVHYPICIVHVAKTWLARQKCADTTDCPKAMPATTLSNHPPPPKFPITPPKCSVSRKRFRFSTSSITSNQRPSALTPPKLQLPIYQPPPNHILRQRPYHGLQLPFNTVVLLAEIPIPARRSSGAPLVAYAATQRKLRRKLIFALLLLVVWPPPFGIRQPPHSRHTCDLTSFNSVLISASRTCAPFNSARMLCTCAFTSRARSATSSLLRRSRSMLALCSLHKAAFAATLRLTYGTSGMLMWTRM